MTTMDECDYIDSAFAAVAKKSVDRDARLNLLKVLLEYFHGRFDTKDGVAEEQLINLQLPVPLRWWFRLGGRSGVLSYQNKFLLPERLRLTDDGKLIFYVENQGVYLWSTAPEGDDPRVWGRFNENGVPWTDEGMPLSEFLIGVALFEAIIQAPFGASAAWIEQEQLDRLSTELPELPLISWRWPGYPSRFYGCKGAFMFSAPNNDSQGNKAFSVWIGSKTPGPVKFLKGFVDQVRGKHRP
jgi:hypothetical protein